MADTDISVKVVADLSDIKASLEEIKKGTASVNQVAGVNIDNVVGKIFVLKAGFDAVVSTIRVVSENLKAVTIDMAILGEKALQVEAGFLRLADGAGIAGVKLKLAIEDAAAGTIESTALLQRSSELITAFGRDATKIPEIIELSRKVARSFGLETEDAFNRISEAIRNGNTKSLKSLGIYIDVDKAVRDFAAANGVAENAISNVGRSQAILNATLDKGRDKFGSVNLSTLTMSESMANLRNRTSDFIEDIGKAISRITAFKTVIDSMASAVVNAGNGFKLIFGTEVEKATAALPGLSNRLTLLTEELNKTIEGKQPWISRVIFGRSKEDIIKDIEDTKARISGLKTIGSGELAGPPSPTSKSSAVENDSFDKQKMLENQRKFDAEINALRLQSANAAVAQSVGVEELQLAQHQREIELEDQNRIKQEEVLNNTILSEQQKLDMIYEINLLHEQRMQELEDLREQEKMAAMQRQLEMTNSFGDQFALAAELQGNRVSQAWQKAGGLGGAAVSAIGNRSVQAFKAMGDGSKSASEAMRDAFFGALGDIAIQAGTVMLLQGIWPPNPIAIAGGAALIALGAALGSMGGGGASAGAGAGAGGSAGFDMGGPGASDALNQRRKEVTINIEGNYFESEQTKLAIVEAVRSSSDANDFTIQKGTRG